MHGLPWSYTWKELKDLFTAANFTNIVRADIAYGRDGRSRVSSTRPGGALGLCVHGGAAQPWEWLRVAQVAVGKWVGAAVLRDCSCWACWNGWSGQEASRQAVWACSSIAVRANNRAQLSSPSPSPSRQGYGTVKFEDEATAQAAIEQFNETELEGRRLTVKLDQYA